MTKINKTAARNLYNLHRSFIIVPCKCAPTSMFASTIDGRWYRPINRAFDSFVAEFTYYNCNAETGRYCHFYIPD